MSCWRFLWTASSLWLGLAAAQPAFEVATLKLSPPPPGDSININLGTFRGGRLTMSNVTLKDMLKYAYGLASDEQIVAPAWNREVRFDVVALADPATPRAQLLTMLQKLIAERLHLSLEHETRVVRHLALVVAAAPRLRDASPEAQATPPGVQVRGAIHHNRMPMWQLAALLSRFERQTVVDATGLDGFFDVNLEWAPDNNLPSEDPNAAPAERPSLFAAVKQQLGLRLESRKGPLPALAVQRCDRVPAEN